MKRRRPLYARLPATPGVYIFKNASGRVLYVGKAANLKKRVSSHFLKAHDRRIEKLVSEIRSVSVNRTESALEALVLESALIKKLDPPYNVREKDDKSFLFIEITKEKYPRVLLVRGKNRAAGERFGPFTSSGSLREAVRLLRKIFPWSTHPENQVGKLKPCFDYQIGLCPGTCFGGVPRVEYLKNLANFKLFLKGKRKLVVLKLEREMAKASGALAFERAAKLRSQLFALRHIQDVALINKPEFESVSGGKNSAKRIEGYDISNISGTDAVGAMVVFSGKEPKKSDYRKFLIKTVVDSNDVKMLREVIRRRFGKAHMAPGWEFPDLVLIDGGKPQVGAARRELESLGISLPLIGIAKGPKRKKNEFFGKIPLWTSEGTLIRVRDEAHRFAVAFHRARRSVRMRE